MGRLIQPRRELCDTVSSIPTDATSPRPYSAHPNGRTEDLKHETEFLAGRNVELQREVDDLQREVAELQRTRTNDGERLKTSEAANYQMSRELGRLRGYN